MPIISVVDMKIIDKRETQKKQTEKNKGNKSYSERVRDLGIFYCPNYILLLLHLNTTHLVSHLSLSSIIFVIISMLVISIFYCLNCTLLLFYPVITHLADIFYNNYVINI